MTNKQRFVNQVNTLRFQIDQDLKYLDDLYEDRIYGSNWRNQRNIYLLQKDVRYFEYLLGFY